MRSFLIVALLLGLSNCILAEGKLISDPNLTANKADVKQNNNQRLAQKVTYEAKRKAVVDILNDLSKLTGITFYAGYNNKDWQVRDLRMNIFAKDIPLADLMNSIARVMKFKWSISGEADKSTYRLYMDRKTLLDAECQRAREEQRFNEEQGKKRSDLISNMQKLSDLSPTEIEKLKMQNPYLYGLSVSGVADAITIFSREMSLDTQSMSPDSSIKLDAASLSPYSQKKLQLALQKATGCYLRLNSNPKYSQTDLSNISNNVKLVLSSHFSLDEAAEVGNYLSFLGMAGIEINGEMISGSFLRDPSQLIAQVEGKALIRSLEGTDSDKAWDEELMAVGSDQIATDFERKVVASIGEEPVEHKIDPELNMKAKLPLYDDYMLLEDAQKLLADAFHISVVSDSFGGYWSPVGLNKTDEVELELVLDNIAQKCRYNWWNRSSIVEFRDRHWFRKRNAQIPQAWIDSWLDTFKNTGTLDIDDLAQIAVLTQEQLSVNILAEDAFERSDFVSVIYSNRDWLRAYASLDDSQKAAIFNSSGLDIATLNERQWKQISELITRKNGAFLQNSDATLKLSGKSDAIDKLTKYDLSLTTSDGLPPIQWSFTTPKYQEEKPKKEAAKEITKDSPEAK